MIQNRRPLLSEFELRTRETGVSIWDNIGRTVGATEQAGVTGTVGTRHVGKREEYYEKSSVGTEKDE